MVERLFCKSETLSQMPKVWARHVLFWGSAVMISLIAIVFAKMSLFANTVFNDISHAAPWSIFLLIPAGFALVVWLTQRLFPGAEGCGIPQVLASLEAPEIADRASVLSLRVALGKVLLTTLGLCSGAAVGREGPTVQIGAAIMHKLANFLRLEDPRVHKALIKAGGAAGISAAFNTPIAGVLFAIEEMALSMAVHLGGYALIAIAVAGIVSMALLGNYTYFGHSSVFLTVSEGWKAVLVCSVIGGFLGGCFSRILLLVSKGLPGRLGRFMKDHPVAFAAVCGLMLACLGQFLCPSIFGMGYDEARGLIEGRERMPEVFGLAKLLAVVISYVSGLPGGLFAPSLSVGAGLGGNMAFLLPDVPYSGVVILGMVGYFSGFLQAPLTATVIVMEMTDDQSLALPLMVTALIGYACSRIVCPKPFYPTMATIFLDQHMRKDEMHKTPECPKGPEPDPDLT